MSVFSLITDAAMLGISSTAIIACYKRLKRRFSPAEDILYRSIKVVPDRPVTLGYKQLRKVLHSDYKMGKITAQRLYFSGRISIPAITAELMKAYGFTKTIKKKVGCIDDAGYRLTADENGDASIITTYTSDLKYIITDPDSDTNYGHCLVLTVYYILFPLEPGEDVFVHCTANYNNPIFTEDQYRRVCAFIGGIIEGSNHRARWQLGSGLSNAVKHWNDDSYW